MRVKCNITVLLLGVSLIGLTTGCSKKVALAPPRASSSYTRSSAPYTARAHSLDHCRTSGG